MANTGLSEWKAAKMINFHSYFPRSNYQRHCIFFVIIALSCIFTISSTKCQVKLSYPTLEALQYNGSWFVIAHKAPSSHSFLPSSVKSSLIKLQIDGEDLNMTEYHSINDTCMPSLSGIWTKKQDSYLMEIRTAIGQLFSMDLRAIYHDYSGEQNEEMNLVIYGCSKTDSYGLCVPNEELVLIMSNSRHPQTLQLFKSAKLIEDAACINILQFKTLDTYTACGDEIVDEDQKLVHAVIDENNEFVDVECRVENFRPPKNNISHFFDEPRILTVTAYIDPALADEQIAHISCLYSTKEHAVCEWIRQNTCFKTQLSQSLTDSSNLKISSNYTRLNGTETVIDWSGTVIWENGDEYISMHCLMVDEHAACSSFRIYVWSDEDHMDQPTINEIYRQLQAVCVDPTDLIFLNTFHECTNPSPVSNILERCGPQEGWSPLNTVMLQGVWYIAADLNADPKIFLQSAVISLTPNETNPLVLELRYFAQKEADSECVGPRVGRAILMDNATLDIIIEYGYTLVPNYKNTMSFKYQVLYLDNQRAALYWCYRRTENGTCTQHDVNFMIRSRHFSHDDLSMVLPYLEKVCIEKDSLRWFDLHSQCGSEMSASTRLRRDLVTLSHYDVLHILTHVQEPKCLFSEVQGVKADLHSLERAGTWFLMARYDEMAMDTYAMVGRIVVVSDTTAVLRLFQSAKETVMYGGDKGADDSDRAMPGEPLDCFTRVFTVKEKQNSTDFYYELHFESTTKNSTTMIFRFLFFNRHVGVIYSCLAHSSIGKCEERAIYVISRHESIDHAELTVLETVAKSVCVDPQVLYHTAAHDECVYDHSLLKLPVCNATDSASSMAEWETLNREQIIATYGRLTYHAVASSKLYVNPFALRFDGMQFQKITEELSGCLFTPVSIEFSARNRLLVRISLSEVVLLHPARSQSDVFLKEAQLTGTLPCLHPIEAMNSTCTQLIPPICKGASPLKVAEQLHGEWLLYASDPSYVLNWRCTVGPHEMDQHEFVCNSESWVGECEREWKMILSVNAWGGFRFTTPAPDMPIRLPSELFPVGNLSATNERLILTSDDDLVGRRYSIWLRTGTQFTNKLAAELEEYCIWPLAAQIRSMEQNC